MFSNSRSQELFSDPLTEVLRNGARALLAQAVEAEISSLLSCHADKLTMMAAGGWWPRASARA